MSSAIDESQRRAARVVGFTYLFAILPALLAEGYVSGRLMVCDNAAETARNIMAHERLFRAGIASNLIVFATDAVLLAALSVVLKPVNRSLALPATFWGLVETAVLVVCTLNSLDALRALRGAEYLRVFEGNRLQALARFSIDAHGAGYDVGLIRRR